MTCPTSTYNLSQMSDVPTSSWAIRFDDIQADRPLTHHPRYDTSLEYREHVSSDSPPATCKAHECCNKPNGSHKTQSLPSKPKSQVITDKKAPPYRRKQTSRVRRSEAQASNTQAPNTQASNTQVSNTQASTTRASSETSSFYTRPRPPIWGLPEFDTFVGRRGPGQSFGRMPSAWASEPIIPQTFYVTRNT